jgi:hypothetical protein
MRIDHLEGAEPKLELHVRGRNRLLTLLPPEEYERVGRMLEKVSCERREPLFGPDRPISHAFFPVSAVASLVITMQDGGTVEVGTVGNEGLRGRPAGLGCGSQPNRSIHPVTWRIPANECKRIRCRDGPQWCFCQRHAPICASFHRASLAVRRVQSPASCRSAPVPLDSHDTRPGRRGPSAADARIYCLHVGCATCERRHRCGHVAESRDDSLPPGHYRRHRSSAA